MLTRFLSLGVLVITLSGCGLLPKNVEYGQKKVKAVPALSDSAKEHQREAALLLATKTQELELRAVATHADPEVIATAGQARTLADSLSAGLGKPLYPTTNVLGIAATVIHDSAKLDRSIDKYRESVEPLVGKKIEGTGWLNLGYFTNLGLMLLIPALLWAGLKIYGMVNPAVGLGTNVVGRVASSTLKVGFQQLIGAGERFKDYLEKSALSAQDKATISDLFQRAHMESQDEHVQTLVKGLTK